jgi:hypothetical protein
MVQLAAGVEAGGFFAYALLTALAASLLFQVTTNLCPQVS